MRREYDFSKGVRGKFDRKGAQLRLPIYLDARLQRRVERVARKKGQDIGEIVNQLVKKQMQS
jgi:cytidylate kinase